MVMTNTHEGQGLGGQEEGRQNYRKKPGKGKLQVEKTESHARPGE